MICQEPAAGHAAVDGGLWDGRFLALCCGRHASEDGWADFKAALLDWSDAGLISRNGGPGPAGAPEVWHRDHWDPIPTHQHEADR
jgi:hypothetical protein